MDWRSGLQTTLVHTEDGLDDPIGSPERVAQVRDLPAALCARSSAEFEPLSRFAIRIGNVPHENRPAHQ